MRKESGRADEICDAKYRSESLYILIKLVFGVDHQLAHSGATSSNQYHIWQVSDGTYVHHERVRARGSAYEHDANFAALPRPNQLQGLKPGHPGKLSNY
jgi:hypothetical protein